MMYSVVDNRKSWQVRRGIQLILLAWAILLSPFTYCQTSQAKETIIWLNDNLPPAFIMDGPEKGNGIVDGVISLYKANLQEYEHQHQEANMARINAMMRKGKKVCYGGFFKTPEREKFIQFSEPNLIALSNGVVVRSDRHFEIIGNKQEVNLSELLKNDSFTLGVTKGRSYGESIDQIIKGQNNRNMIVRSGRDSLLGLLEMVENGRIDYTIGFPWEVSYLTQLSDKRSMFSVAQVSENSERQWTKNYIGCPKNDWGKKIIERINNVLKQLLPTKEHRYHQLKWFPVNLQEVAEKAYVKTLLSNSVKAVGNEK